jgi:hypothetical protein
MKKIFFIILFFSMNIHFTNACDICGCSASGAQQLGILPQYRSPLLGVRYFHRSFENKMNHGGLLGEMRSNEAYQTVDIWSRYVPFRRVQLFAFLPFHRFNRVSEEGGETKKVVTEGVGDASILVNFELINIGDSLCGVAKHLLLLGGGVKLPTGDYQRKDINGDLLFPNIQMGSGSTDFLLNINYLYRLNDWGINVEANYRITQKNKLNYQFGNRLGASAGIFYRKIFSNWTFLSHVSSLFEYLNEDYEANFKVYDTGGYATYGNVGADVYVGKVMFGANYQIPLHQNLAGGITNAKNRFRLSVNYLF